MITIFGYLILVLVQSCYLLTLVLTLILIHFYLSDIRHHHLAIGVLLVLSSHIYSSLFSAYGHNIKSLASSNGNPFITVYLYKSLNLNLSFALMGLSF